MEKMNLNIIINNPDFIKPTKKSQVLFILHSNFSYTENQEIDRINKKIYLKNSIPEGRWLWEILSR